MSRDIPEPLPAYLVPRDNGCLLRVRVVPRAGRTALAGARDGALVVRLAAAPVEGAANDALVAVLAQVLDVPRRAITLLSGEHARDKRLLIAGTTAEAIARRLAAARDR